MTKAATDPALCSFREYADGVRDGTIIAGRYVQKAVERWHRDLATADERGLWFDEAAALRAIRFIELLRHSKGRWRGTMLVLSGWQRFIIANLFGWRWRASGFRRYKRAYIEIARKNGKSTLAAAIALYMLVADREGAPEVYTAATSKEQAKIVFAECKRMVKASPYLARTIAILREELAVDSLDAVLRPLHSASESLDGLNTHCGVVDEYHEHKSSEVYDKISTSTGSRDQSLVFIITTAGRSLESACYHERAQCINLIEGITSDDSLFVFVACVDDGDDWTKEDNWRKSNPNLGVSRSMQGLREDFARAANSAKHEADFKRYFLNRWTNEETRWLRLDDWRECPSTPIDEESLRGEPCFAGVDLSSTKDITALVYWFPNRRALVCRFFIPGDNMHVRERRDKVPFSRWVKEGWITKTDGNVTDYAALRATLQKDAGIFNIMEIGYDTWNATQLSTELMADGFTMVHVPQNFKELSEASKELEKLVVSHRLIHGGNPVLQWMASVVVVLTDGLENIRPSKKASFERIDGIMAAVIAMSRSVRHAAPTESVYEERGVTIL